MATTIRGSDNFDTAENGRVLQYSYVQHPSTSSDITSTSYVTVLEDTITPKNTNSKIVIQITGQFYKYNNSGGSNPFRVSINEATNIESSYLSWNDDNSQQIEQGGISCVHQNSGSSPLTVKFEVNAGSSGRIYIYGSIAHMHIWEIAQ